MHVIIDVITSFFYQHRYIFAFLGALFEGMNIMLLAGFLYKLGFFKFFNVLALLSAGYFINGYAWYALGRFGGRKILEKRGVRFFLTKERLKKIERYFKKHTNKALIITRITYGISSYVFILAGIFKTKAKQFFWCNLIATLIWVLTLFGIGYSFGASYKLVSRVAKLVSAWLVIVAFITTILIAMGLVYWLRQLAKIKFFEKIVNQGGWERIKLWSRKFSEFLNKYI